MERLQTPASELSTSELARALGISMGTIARYTDLGRLHPRCTPAGQRRFTERDVQELTHALAGGPVLVGAA
jgi:DNA-binding transcriptional MerR regulator